jgi:cytidylate kinase
MDYSMTKKDKIKEYIDSIPLMLKYLKDIAKKNFDINGQELVENSNGIVPILIKLFAKEQIDNYFEERSKGRLDNFASKIYLESALAQVQSSLECIDEIDQTIDVSKLLEESIDTIKIDDSEAIALFVPIYNPIIIKVKELVEKILKDLHIDSKYIDKFIKDYNTNIEKRLKDNFVDDEYEKHKLEVSEYISEKSEAKLLYDTYNLKKIGFSDDESLTYMSTYARYKEIDTLLKSDDRQEEEEGLEDINILIDEYFESRQDEQKLHSILFLVADFGKGKTVFLREFASRLAKEYIDRADGYIPIYFNLREYSTYANSSAKYGVIDEYLKVKYDIDISSQHYKNKKYYFLMDSLDESGELDRGSIDKVISSISQIRDLEKNMQGSPRDSRVIVTTRPFSEGLIEHISSKTSYKIDDKMHYISLYGFTKEQFNEWLYTTLRSYSDIESISTTGFAKEIVDSIKDGTPIDIYTKLIDDKTLSKSELRRPIFAYMIYQLIIKDIDFLAIGKIGIYLSFINLLTKEAKHKDDSVDINLIDEVKYRKILHTISALWQYRHHLGKQATLKKADICRALEAENIDKDDDEIIKEFRDKRVLEVKFLSHSYFGEENNTLHFQHQSFAEILIAEYYLKVILKYALDDGSVDDARRDLSLGMPTAQSMEFFTELLRLLKSSVDDSDGVEQKRRLLLPLLLSLAIKDDSIKYKKNLVCSRLYNKWYEDIVISEYDREYPQELIDKWPIKAKEIDKIVSLAKDILNSKKKILLTKSYSDTSLYDNEITTIDSDTNMQIDIDKWIMLVVGNTLYTDKEQRVFFNARLDDAKILFDMIREYNYIYKDSAPYWAKKHFIGIECSGDSINMSHSDLSDIDFSYSNLRNIDFRYSYFEHTNFSNSTLEDIDFSHSIIGYSIFDDITLFGECYFVKCILGSNSLWPNKLIIYNEFKFDNYLENNKNKTYIDESLDIFTLEGFFQIALNNGQYSVDEIKSWFEYSNEGNKKIFESDIDRIAEELKAED